MKKSQKSWMALCLSTVLVFSSGAFTPALTTYAAEAGNIADETTEPEQAEESAEEKTEPEENSASEETAGKVTEVSAGETTEISAGKITEVPAENNTEESDAGNPTESDNAEKAETSVSIFSAGTESSSSKPYIEQSEGGGKSAFEDGEGKDNAGDEVLSSDANATLEEDTANYIQYNESRKGIYTYEDSDVKVTAILQHASAVPDDAKLRVTLITEKSTDYNYDAYIQALNDDIENNESGSRGSQNEYSKNNILLYDVAFVGYSEDENGNINHDKLVEYEPSEGYVRIEVSFKKNQLSHDLAAEKNEDIELVHLPLRNEIRENSDTTKEVRAISSKDIVPEKLDNISVSVDNETVSFTLNSLSVIAARKINDLTVKTYDHLTAKSILGDAWQYGILADVWEFNGEAEANFAVGKLTGPKGGEATGATGVSGTGDLNGRYFLAEGSEYASSIVREINGKIQIKGLPETITTTEKNRVCIRTDSSLLQGGSKSITFNIKSEDEINNELQSLFNGIDTEALDINKNSFTGKAGTITVGGVNKDYKFITNDSKIAIDLQNYPDGTYYIDITDFAEYRPDTHEYLTLQDKIGQTGNLTIKKNINQTIVFNYAGSNPINIGEFFVEQNKKTYSSCRYGKYFYS